MLFILICRKKNCSLIVPQGVLALWCSYFDILNLFGVWNLGLVIYLDLGICILEFASYFEI
jgi:hypothetical protein